MKIAIDLGTTNSLVTVRKDGADVLIPNQFGNTVTPSIVCIANKEIFIGEIAFEKELEFPKGTFRLFKRSMGEPKKINKSKYTAIDLSSLLIQQLINDAEKSIGESVDEVVISVPAYFTDAQRQATRQSALRCGVECKRIINEPSAAALAYYQETKNEGLVLVFDFGGGTLDVTVVDIFDGIVDIVSISGDNNLGGHDLDTILFESLMDKYPALKTISLEEKYVLMKRIEKLKIDLSTQSKASLVLNINETSQTFTISQQEYIEKSSMLLHRIKTVVATALTDAGITAADIDDVVFVGGSSKSIIVQEFIRELMGRTVNVDVNPDEAIIKGLGIMLAIMDREPGYKDIILTDVCPFSLGVQTVGDIYSPIISRNTTLPTIKKQSYITLEDAQSQMNFTIYQGEAIVASSNSKLISTNVRLKKKPKGEAKANVTFSYDINGILKVLIDGDDVITPYTNEITTNSMISGSDFKQTQNLLNNLSKQKTLDRSDLLIARIQRLDRELMPNQRDILETLFKEFSMLRLTASKGELILIIKKINEQLDILETQLVDPFARPATRHLN